MAKKKKYPIRLTEQKTITIGWLHLCAQCGEEFESPVEAALTCSLACKQKKYRETKAKKKAHR